MTNKHIEDRLESLRNMVFLPLTYLVLAGISLLAAMSFVSTGGSSGLFEFFICVAIVVNLFLSLGKISVSKAGVNLMAIIGIFLVGGLYIYQQEQFGVYWLVLYPMVAVLFLGINRGLIFVGALIAALLPLPLSLIEHQNGMERSDYVELIISLCLVAALVTYYEYLLDKQNRETVSSSKKISNTSQSLKNEVAQRERAEQKMAEALKELEVNNQELARAKAIDEATISSIGEAVVIVNPQGIIIRANPSSGRVLGLNQADLIGQKIAKSLSFTIPGKEKEVLEEKDIAIESSMQHRSIDEATYQITRPNHTTFYGQMTASPLVVEGVVYGAVVAIRDVTQEVTVDKAKSEFVSIASHQLRTPLSTINWYLEMVLAGDFGDINDEQHEFILEAAEASKRMGGLINSLLNASRIDVGVVSVEPERLDIRDLIRDALVDLESKVNDKNMKINISVDSSVKPMPLDARIMEIIFLNLISNAIKYSPENSEIDVSATLNKHLEIKVSDHGFGIPESSQDKIFSKMFRAENAVEHEPDGNGLGLYIIHSILETIGGSIKFESLEGKGTTFTVLLPQEGMRTRKGSRQLSVKPDA